MLAYPPYNERELLLRASKGDKEAFTSLVMAYKDEVYTVSCRITQYAPLAEDMVQDVFLKIWLKRAELPQIENFGGWLRTVTRNTLLTELKRMARVKLREQIAYETYPDPAYIEEDPVARKELAVILKKAIETLPERQRQVYQLVREQGIKREQAASILGISPETIKFHLTQALKNLRVYLITHGELSSLVLFFLYSFNFFSFQPTLFY